jgi:tetratricopeptide (TPR) repeat protein
VSRRVFISSASGGLTAYRSAAVDVCHRLGMTPVFMEEFEPQRPPPIDVCRDLVASADLFVLLLAHRYGSRPPGESRSFTEIEYAVAAARDGLTLLPFVIDPDHPWPPRDVDHGPDADALAALVDRVSTAHVVKRFTTVERFREDLLLALRVHATTAEPSVTTTPRPPQFHAVPPYAGSAPFTGRRDDLAGLDTWARSADPVMVVEAIGGIGKSALTWEWASNRAPAAVAGLAGRLWWSFYDGSPSIVRFLREVLAYATGRSPADVRRLSRTDLTAQTLAALRSRPFLLVLDGFERLLNAYHRFEPSKLLDESVEQSKRSMIDPQAEDVLRELTTIAPSRVLISSRLMPDALVGRFGQRMPGVRHLRLPSLSDDDTVTLLERIGVRGSRAAITGFFSGLDNHPLLVGVVSGLVRDYRPAPGDFVRWLQDPMAGGGLALPELDLTQRRTHILAAALRGLSSGSHRLLSWISVLSGEVAWSTLEAINPFTPPPPSPIVPDLSALGPRPTRIPSFTDEKPPNGVGSSSLAWKAAAEELHARADLETEKQLAQWRTSGASARSKAQLDRALKDLEERGLLWWDRSTNCYDLHPIIRAYVHDQLEGSDRVRANKAVRDHFEALPPERPDQAASVEDLHQTITIFRALVGARLFADADRLWWQALDEALLVRLGAYPTVVELLGPLAKAGNVGARSTLAIAYHIQGRYDEAIKLDRERLADLIGRSRYVATSLADKKALSTVLARLSTAYRSTGRLAYTAGLLTLRQEVNRALSTIAREDANLSLDQGILYLVQGEVERARNQIERVAGMAVPQNSPWFTGNLRLSRLELELRAGTGLKASDLDKAEADLPSVRHRIRLAYLRLLLAIQQDDLDAALAAAQTHERLGRNAGFDTTPAASAYVFARMGRHDLAAAAAEETGARMSRIHPADRPHLWLGKALARLGRLPEAADQAREAYRQAWCDGPPHQFCWTLSTATELLTRLGQEPPDMPVIDPASTKVPMADEVRAFIGVNS